MIHDRSRMAVVVLVDSYIPVLHGLDLDLGLASALTAYIRFLLTSVHCQCV